MPETSGKILLVEDELNLGKAIEIALKRKNFEVAWEKTLSTSIERVKREKFDLVILDRMLPDGDGIELFQKGKNELSGSRVLVLSAKGSVEDKVEGLRSGADDYLAKPFRFEEFGARIDALLRRTPEPVGGEAVRSKLWESDSEKLRIKGPKGWVGLTPMEYKVMTYFLARPGVLVSRERLLREVWGFRFMPRTRTIDFFMQQLRRHFEPTLEEPRHLLTIRGMGYRFEPKGLDA